MAPPPRGPPTPGVARGRVRWPHNAGCAPGCHWSGVPGVGKIEFWRSRSSTSGLRITASLAAASRATIGAGVPAGASSAKLLVASKPGKPLSAMVGTVGASGLRSSVLTPIARIWPACISGSAVTPSTIATCTSLVISACTAGAPPR